MNSLQPLTKTASSSVIQLPSNLPITLGRAQVDATDVRISRQHATAHANVDGGVQLTASKPLYIQPAAAEAGGGGEQGLIIALAPGATHLVSNGQQLRGASTMHTHLGRTLCVTA